MMAGITQAVGQGFPLPDSYCPMAHCDPQMSDQVGETPPLGPVNEVFSDVGRPGSLAGLGCSSNGTLVACSYRKTNQWLNNLVVYHWDGAEFTMKWEEDIGEDAWQSAPMVTAATANDDGDVIATSGQTS
ncbi:MAG: hypothetical protein ACE5JX_20555 [Acidobacteriota bacterium]